VPSEQIEEKLQSAVTLYRRGRSLSLCELPKIIPTMLVRLDHVASFMEPAPEAKPPPEDSEQKTG
jgi:hypothetical protein